MSRFVEEMDIAGTPSIMSGTPASPSVQRYDGHRDGHLNCIAVRHGWTRKFSIPPHVLDTLSYSNLEQILEINTLKIRSHNLRIFVENPAGSGIYAKVRYWKDDGSLQSVLVKQFFEGRMDFDPVAGDDDLVGSEAAHMRLEIRDGHDRDDTVSMRGGIIGVGTSGGSRLNLAGIKGRLSRSASRGGPVTDTEDEDITQSTISPPQPSRTQAFMYLIGLSAAPATAAPAPPPVPSKEDEEAVLKKRGWLAPGLRRIASRRSVGSKSGGSRQRLRQAAMGNPFFSPGERKMALAKAEKGKGVDPSGGEEGQAEEGAEGEAPEAGASDPLVEPKDKDGKKTRWLGIGGRS